MRGGLALSIPLRIFTYNKEIKVMKKQHLINNTYQVVDNNDNVLFQGSEIECNEYIMDQGMENLLNRINNNPELLDVFKRLADR
jgi:hypothetical protein